MPIERVAVDVTNFLKVIRVFDSGVALPLNGSVQILLPQLVLRYDRISCATVGPAGRKMPVARKRSAYGRHVTRQLPLRQGFSTSSVRGCLDLVHRIAPQVFVFSLPAPRWRPMDRLGWGPTSKGKQRARANTVTLR